MEEILHTFGIDWRLIGIQIFNFGILLALLWYFLYTPILRLIDERRAKIAQGVKDAEEAGQKLAEAESERAALVNKAHQEAKDIESRAKAHADEKSAALVAEAQHKSARIVEEAEREGVLRKERLYKEGEAEIAKTALLAAERILKERG